MTVSSCPLLSTREIFSAPYLIERILINLISNAIKFTPKNGQVQISIDSNQSQWTIAVKDSGIGVPKNHQKHIFEKFRQLEGASGKDEGIGLGLAIVKDFCEILGGECVVESKEHVGSEFKIVFPFGTSEEFEHSSNPKDQKRTYRFDSEVDDRGNTHNLQKETLDWNHSRGSDTTLDDVVNVLIVEDNPALSKVMELSLEDVFNVKVAKDGIKALEILDSWQPDIIVSDLMMPRLDGFELCRKIKSSPDTKQIPFIILSAYAQSETIEEGLAIGVSRYLTKPFNFDELKNCIYSLLAIREGQNIPQKEKQNKDGLPSSSSFLE